MNELGKEYGSALYMLACEENKVSEFSDALDTLVEAFNSEPEYIEFVSSPAIPLCDRIASLENAFSTVVPDGVMSFLLLMCEKGRLSVFFDAVDEFKALFDFSKKLVNVKITSAIELTDEEKNKLKNKIETVYNFNIVTEFFVDSAILGGIVVEFDGKVIDGSVRHRLREVKDVIST